MAKALLHVVLPFASPSQNVTQKWHWSKRAKLRDQCQLIFRAAARRAKIECPPGRRLRLDIVRSGPRLLDHGNLVGGCKPVVDALVREGLLQDDSPKWVDDHYAQTKPAKGAGSTLVTLSEIG